jgi:carbonic anhydrase/acetyltransferase-like protein (isoleucine patch superfamily)
VTVGHLALLHGCIIEDGAFIGMKACVMDGAVVESGAVVAAGALVTPGKRVKKGEMWAGSPAKLMRAVTPEEFAGFADAARRYADLADEYLGIR